MTDIASIKRDLAAFGAAYQYDTSYAAELVDASPTAFITFSTAAQSLGGFKTTLPLEAHWIAGIATALAEDCGACAQLGLRRAVQEGVDRARLRQLVEAPETLPSPLRDIHDLARGVCEGEPDDLERAARLRAAYGEEGIAEIALCIAGARLYPTLKRALSRNSVCMKPTLDF